MPVRIARYAVAVALGVSLGCARTPASPDPIPSPSSAAPPQAVLRISPGPADAPLGAEAHTAFVFDGSASTGNGLSYRIEFGDGESAASALASHVVASSGARTARLTVTDADGRTAVAEQPYFVARVETNYPFTYWQGHLNEGDVRIQLRRDGTGYSGLAHILGVRNIPIAGSLVGDRDFVVRSADGGIEMVGTLQWKDAADINFSQGRVVMRLTIRGSDVDGATVFLSSVDTY